MSMILVIFYEPLQMLLYYYLQTLWACTCSYVPMKILCYNNNNNPPKKKVWPIKKHLIYFLTMILELLWFLIYCPNKSKSNYFLMASSRWLANKLNLIIGMSLELGTYQTHTGVVIETQKGMSGILMNRSKTLLKF